VNKRKTAKTVGIVLCHTMFILSGKSRLAIVGSTLNLFRNHFCGSRFNAKWPIIPWTSHSHHDDRWAIFDTARKALGFRTRYSCSDVARVSDDEFARGFHRSMVSGQITAMNRDPEPTVHGCARGYAFMILEERHGEIQREPRSPTHDSFQRAVCVLRRG
jgi:hypothetical protein